MRRIVKVNHSLRFSVILAGVVLLFAASLLSCSDRDETFRQEVEALEVRTVPHEAGIRVRSGPVRSNWSVAASWDFDTTMSRVTYSNWLAAQLEPELKMVTADETQLAFSKYKGGDTESVECTFSLTGRALHVHVVFDAYAD